LEAAAASPAAPDGKRRRRGLVLALVVLASIIAFLAVFSIWAKRQALETDNWVETSTELLEDEEIRTQVAAFMVDTLYANVDVQAELEGRLPPDLKGLAGPAAAGIRQLTDQLANEALQRPRVQQAWEQLNRTAHETLIRVVEDNADEPVTLDLGSLVEQVGSEAGINVAGRLPPDAGEIEVLSADDLSTAGDVIDVVEELAIVLSVLAILLFAAAIYLARGWRREALRAVGFGLIVVGLAVAVVRTLAGNAIVDALASTASVEPAVEDTWEIGTSLLSDGAGAMVFYGIMIVLGAWLAGPMGLARGARRAIAPALNHRGVGYAFLAAILLLLFWWAPTEGFHRLPISLLIIALFVLGFEILRRQTVREFPDETWERGSQRWRETGRSLLQRRR
jgi:hypothetical protein